ncbi:MAG: OmpA family protein [Thermodesulfobacteriota bacterium]|nr:OmpA family protein [Thermodesulfobacteriota bacterium]
MKKLFVCFFLLFAIFLPLQSSIALTAEGWFEDGVSLENQCVYGEAIKKYSEAIKLNPDYSEAYFRRGKSYAMAPSTSAEALDDFTRVIELDPKNADAYYERGLINAYIINNEQAKLDMETAACLGHEGAMEWLNPKEKEVSYVQLGSYMTSGKAPVAYFDFDKYDIKPAYNNLLDEIGTVLKEQLPEILILIMGHTDNSGSEKYNINLSLKRAEAISQNLKESGIDSSRIVIRGYGEKNPATSNKTEEGRILNRRVEMIGVEQ